MEGFQVICVTVMDGAWTGAASLKAINDWLAEDAKPKACRSELVYPPVHDGEL
eukprot:m.173119 g.173119  ORF g.173119 m.173119 type:complete len:53 (+) comp18296_c0_seq12:3025-3183(+)